MHVLVEVTCLVDLAVRPRGAGAAFCGLWEGGTFLALNCILTTNGAPGMALERLSSHGTPLT